MTPSLMVPPTADPTPMLETIDQHYGAYILAAAVGHFDVFDRLAERPRTEATLGADLGLAPRATSVFLTALRAMDLVVAGPDGLLAPSAMAREHLCSDSVFGTARYLRLRGRTPEVVAFVARLRENAAGDYYQHGRGRPSMMDNPARCRAVTLSLAGLARPIVPYFVRSVRLDGANTLLDIGCGSGLYGMACLQAWPNLRVKSLDHPNVLAVVRDLAAEHGVADRLECVPADMYTDPLPRGCDAVLISNVLHDWDEPQCERLIARAAEALAPGGQLMIHGFFLNDGLDGPLGVAMHSVALFCGTQGRIYSGAEVAAWITKAGLDVTGPIQPTLAHQGVLAARKPE